MQSEPQSKRGGCTTSCSASLLQCELGNIHLQPVKGTGSKIQCEIYIVCSVIVPANNLIQMFLLCSTMDNFTIFMVQQMQIRQILYFRVLIYYTTQSRPNICKKRSFDKVWTKEWYMHPSPLT